MKAKPFRFALALWAAAGWLYLRRLTSFSFENNVYAQIGLIMLVGLAAKNAILIVEFAKRASGSGAVSRQVMGTAVIGGIAAASAIAIFIIAALFYVIERIGGAKHEQSQVGLPATPQAHAANADD